MKKSNINGDNLVGKTTKLSKLEKYNSLILYRLSPLSGSTIAIDTQLEKVALKDAQLNRQRGEKEIVSTVSNNRLIRRRNERRRDGRNPHRCK